MPVFDPDPTEGIKWSSSTITWSFATSNLADQSAQFSSFITADSYKSLVEKAVELWSSVADISMPEVSDSSSADIRIGFQSFDPNTSNEIGQTSYSYDPETETFDPGIQIGLEDPARIALSPLPDSDYSIGNYDSKLFQVIVHELGHALGLAHNTADPQAVMNPTATSSNQSIDTNDALAIEQLYGGSYAQLANLTMSTGTQGNYIDEPDTASNPLSGISVQDGAGLFETVTVTEIGGGSLSDPTANSGSDFTGGVFTESGDNLTSTDYAQSILQRLVYTPTATSQEAYLTVDVTNSLSGSQTIDSLIVGPTDINSMYETILGRPGDTGSLQSAVLYLDNGGSANSLKGILADSAEAQTDITNIYEDVLGRAPDSGALPACSEALINGTSLDQLRTGVVDSAEAQADITDIYEDVLGRAPDAGAVPACTQALLNGESLAQLRSGLANSSEGQADITNIYESIIGGFLNPFDFSQYSQDLVNGMSLSQLRTQIAYSIDAQANIFRLYESVLEREASSDEVSACSAALASGTSFNQLRTSFANSAEAQDDIINIYENVLGRAPDPGGLTACTQALSTGTALSALRDSIAFSPESQSNLTNLFENIIDRPPDVAEFKGMENILASNPFSLSYIKSELMQPGPSAFVYSPTYPGYTTIYESGGPEELTLSGNFGHLTIDGFDLTQNALVFSQAMATTFSSLAADFSSADGGTLITLDSSNSVLLPGVSLTNLASGNFRFTT